MPRIFISYRRDDSAGHAGRLYDRLRAHFGADRVFMDVTGIEAGTDFVEAIDTAVGGCDVLIAVIGRQWLKCTDNAGHRRLEDPRDFICLEVGSALKRKVRVVPVLVEGAAMPGPADLPERLQGLTRRQAVELRDTRWDADVEDLIAALTRIPELAAAVTPPPPPSPISGQPVTSAQPTGEDRSVAGSAGVRLPKVWLAGGLAALLLLLLGLWLGQRSGPETSTVATAEPAPPAVSPGADTPPVIPETTPPAPPPGAEREAAPARPATPAAPDIRRPVLRPELRPATPARRLEPLTPAPDAARVVDAPGPSPSPPPTLSRPQREAVVRAPAVSDEPAARTATASRPAPVLARVAVVAWGKPSHRSFWNRQQARPYSERMAALFAQALRARLPEGADVRLMVAEGYARGIAQEQSVEQARRLCQEASVSWVFAALAEEPFAISPAESAYWPELRLVAVRCSSPEPSLVKEQLAPRQGEDFPFASDMRAAMQRFARELGRLDGQ